MGYGELGGNGSVHWLIDADEVDDGVEKGRMFGTVRKAGGKEWRQHGCDYYGKRDAVGANFTVRVKLPTKNRAEWLEQVKRKLDSAQDLFEFTLPIDKSDQPHAQIQVCWGKAPSWEDNLYRLSTDLRGPASSK
jgi:hypothetical protein